MGKNFKNLDDETQSEARNNVRQLGSPVQSGANQNQILSALDILGAKLVRSETERETMRKLLNDALDAQEKLENQLERSQMNLQRRLDQVEMKDAALSEEDRKFIEEQKESFASARELLDGQQDRQVKIEDKLRDSAQTIAKLQRRIDAQEQKRAKLQRRVERVENIAADAQNALEAKAMVLLTDQSDAVRALPHYNAGEAMQTLETLHQPDLDSPKKTRLKKVGGGSSTSILAILLALGIGWGAATTLQPSEKAFVVMKDGQLAQVDLKDGIAQPIAFQAEPKQLNVASNLVSRLLPNSNVIQPTTAPAIEEDIAFLTTDWITDDIITQAIEDVTEVNVAEALNTETAQTPAAPTDLNAMETATADALTIDRDPTLPEDLKQLEDKAFARIPEAQHDLAALYTAGQAGVTQNYERAAYWFRQAADQGIGNAAYNLGVLHQQGLGQEQNLQRALDWYRRAAQLGHPEAQYNLGIAYIEGVGTRYNPNMAAAFFQRAAFSGVVEAAYNLGLILENGLLGEVRPNEALKWYRAAAESGNPEAEQALANLSRTMDIPVEQAGYLENGESLAGYIRPIQSIEPSTGHSENEQAVVQADETITLGALVPSQDQIMIAQIQEQLRKADMYNGPQDGIVGAGTVQAIKNYQRANDMNVDGMPTEELLTYMLQQGTG